MPIPAFDDNGLLPQGVWDTTLDEIAKVFLWNEHRRYLWVRFLAFLSERYRPAGGPSILWIDGSFTTSKEQPSDVDVVADCQNGNGNQLAAALGMRFEHSLLKSVYKVDFWIKHPHIPNDLTEFFQYVGDKSAVALNLVPKHPKGILRIAP